jgi:hypothetical protein
MRRADRPASCPPIQVTGFYALSGFCYSPRAGSMLRRLHPQPHLRSDRRIASDTCAASETSITRACVHRHNAMNFRCSQPCARRRRPTTQFESQTSFTFATRLAPAHANGSAATRELSHGHDQQVCTPSLPGRCTDSRVHLLRILAQRPAHGGARPPYSLTLEPVSPCHSS